MKRSLPFLGLVLILSIWGCTEPDQPKRPNLLLISLDTLRADHLGCYGYSRPTSPVLDSLVREKEVVLFENCISQAPTTVPSHMTLFTSLFPTAHGVADQPSHGDALKKTRFEKTKMLAEVLRDAGYRTAGIVDGGNLAPVFGLSTGFQEYQCKYEGAMEKVDQALAWLDKNGAGEAPFFLFLHTYEVHAPYMPPDRFRELFTGDYKGWVRDYCYGPEAKVDKELSAFTDLFKRPKEFDEADLDYLMALYDGEIAFTDREMGRLWAYLGEKDLFNDTIVVILSDHGEAFLDHDRLGHGAHVYSEMVHVPLIFRLPERLTSSIERHRVPEDVALVDVMPTLLDLLSIKDHGPSPLQGQSLRPLWEQRNAAKPRPALAEIIRFDSVDPMARSVQLGGKKLVYHAWKDYTALFDLENDPHEKKNLAPQRPGDVAALQQIFDSYHSANIEIRKAFSASFDEEDKDKELYEELQQLGY